MGRQGRAAGPAESPKPAATQERKNGSGWALENIDAGIDCGHRGVGRICGYAQIASMRKHVPEAEEKDRFQRVTGPQGN